MEDTLVGFYKIENKINNKVYIGASVNVENRLKNHQSLLKCNKHPNKTMQNDYNVIKKKGDNPPFSYSVLEEGINIRKTDEIESYYISFYNSVENGYNKPNASPYGKSDKRKVRLNTKKITDKKEPWSIKMCRKNSKFSTSFISEYLEISQDFYTDIERENDFPDIILLLKFSEIVDVPDSFISCSIKGKEKETFDFKQKNK